MNPEGGEILPCPACEITSCQIRMKEVPYFGHLEWEEWTTAITFADWIA